MPNKPRSARGAQLAKADPLSEVLAQVHDRIHRAKGRALGEQNTKSSMIDPVLRALGWNTEDVDEVVREFKVRSRDKPVDYALLTMRTPRLFVEAKGNDQDLDDRRWANQIMSYALVAGVEWIVLTNGDEYRLYNTHAPVAVDEKLFRAVRVSDGGHHVAETLGLLAKDKMQENLLEVLWKAQFVDRQVEAALKKLFERDNDLLLLNHVLKHAKSLSAPDVRASLARCKHAFDFPAMTVSLARATAATRDPHPALPSSSKGSAGAGASAVLALIRAGILTPPIQLVNRYRGRDLEATIEADGRVRFQGELYDSLSTAANWARVSVIGRHGGKMPATNGWDFWRCIDSDGALVQVGQLRSRLPAQGKASAG